MAILTAHVARTLRGFDHYNTLVPALDVTVAFHYLADKDDAKDDTVTLQSEGDDGAAYSRTYRLDDTAHVEVLDDNYLQVTFRNLPPETTFALKIDPGKDAEGQTQDPYFVFRHVLLPPEQDIPVVHADVAYDGGEDVTVEAGAGDQVAALPIHLQRVIAEAGMREREDQSKDEDV
jgi:hypothetical protein